MKRTSLIILIFFLACILRFWQLGINPPSLDWDEASLGYNAYSILKTGRDEYGFLFPLSIRSFGDYKPPLYTYLTIPWVAIGGLNEFSVRGTSAFFGSLTVLVTYMLVSFLFPKKHRFALLSMFFLAVSPWHIQFSRIAFESNISIFFVALGMAFFLKALSSSRYLYISALMFGMSLYAYHSPRVFVPLMGVGLLCIYWKQILNRIRVVFLSCIIIAFCVAPIIVQMTSSTGARFGSVTIMNPQERLGTSIKRIEADREDGMSWSTWVHNRRLVYGRDILAGYLDHWNIDFLFLTGDAPGRHHASGMGMLYWWEIFIVPVGMYALWRWGGTSWWVILVWYLLAPVAASLTSGTPHAVRALLFLPIYPILSASGVLYIRNYIANMVSIVKPISLVISLMLFLFCFYYYLTMYWIHSPIEEAREWQYGYKQTVQAVQQVESKYNHIIVTYRYDQPYVFFLFYDLVDPMWYQAQWRGGDIQRFSRNFGKYEFRNIDWDHESKNNHTLYVGTAEEIPEGTQGIIREISFPDGSIAFRLVGT